MHPPRVPRRGSSIRPRNDLNWMSSSVRRSRQSWSTSGLLGASLAACWLPCWRSWPRSTRAVSSSSAPTPMSCRRLPTQFNVQSIPAVFALVDGQVVDFFQGLLPESELRSWLDRVLLAGTLVDARAREEADPAAAERLYRQVVAAIARQRGGPDRTRPGTAQPGSGRGVSVADPGTGKTGVSGAGGGDRQGLSRIAGPGWR